MSVKLTPVRKLADVRPGDRALHRNGRLDSRPVHKIDAKRNLVWLEFPGGHTGTAFTADNYTYTRLEYTPDTPKADRPRRSKKGVCGVRRGPFSKTVCMMPPGHVSDRHLGQSPKGRWYRWPKEAENA